ncbi:MAG: TetR/AcrR family transcriptional regulator [Betaproteobacteria bacterium]|nr:TetR/AcrR family transcriptional regulator [Betaproteobacteria bacterium]
MHVNRKEENSARTRAALEKAARELFEARGFAAVSAEELVARAGVTRGALYHHYDGKEGLFEAIVAGAMKRLNAGVQEAAAKAKDPLSALRLGIERFLELAAAPRVQRVLFVDAPAVMGWTRWREMDERHGLGLLKQGIAAAIQHKQLREQDPSLAAHVLLSALIESAMLIARSTDKARLRAEAQEMLFRLLEGLGRG